jgi:hypothetical protein
VNVLEHSPKKYWLLVHYADLVDTHICYPDGRFAGELPEYDLVRRSPWEKIRRDISVFRMQNPLALKILDGARKHHELPFLLDA